MKVAILADPIDNQNAGVHNFTKEMVNAMIRTNSGHEIILIREKVDEQLSGAVQIAIPNIRLPIGFASLRLFLLVPFILRLKKVNVVIEPAHFGPFNLPAKVKRVTIIHDLTPILFPRLHRWHSQFLQKLFLKRILKKANLIISNSENTSKDICKFYPHICNKVTRIYPGKGKIFKPESHNDVLSSYKITTPYFLFTGTIEPRKNLNLFLKAYQIFKTKCSTPFQLVIVGGTGWKSDSFFEALKNHPDKETIICTGFVPSQHLPALYSHATAFVYPSIYEGFGLPVIEAMACGAPVVVAENSSLTEAGGEATLYFKTNDADNLAEKMLLLAHNEPLRKELSAKGLVHSAKFNWDEFAVTLWNKLIQL
jgi:glycosyltransferase involved in cell wall biosynthesis